MTGDCCFGREVGAMEFKRQTDNPKGKMEVRDEQHPFRTSVL